MGRSSSAERTEQSGSALRSLHRMRHENGIKEKAVRQEGPVTPLFSGELFLLRLLPGSPPDNALHKEELLVRASVPPPAAAVPVEDGSVSPHELQNAAAWCAQKISSTRMPRAERFLIARSHSALFGISCLCQDSPSLPAHRSLANAPQKGHDVLPDPLSAPSPPVLLPLPLQGGEVLGIPEDKAKVPRGRKRVFGLYAGRPNSCRISSTSPNRAKSPCLSPA